MIVLCNDENDFVLMFQSMHLFLLQRMDAGRGFNTNKEINEWKNRQFES